ncbi:DNA cytosine methyltransferase [Kineococcus auxinigenes]|uniref:DNA methylase n=1 Tax=unclassified Kineococcus TaxID=2621656 RepID=UPI003D7DA4FF
MTATDLAITFASDTRGEALPRQASPDTEGSTADGDAVSSSGEKPRLLDLFCCAGGAGKGYHDAGFDVVGIDINEQPNYPYDFHQSDALAYLEKHAGEFDVFHASPPCQAHTALTKGNRRRPGWTDEHVDLIPATRDLLDEIGKPYIIENVQGSTVRRDVTLCGVMFGLQVIRHRYFELGNWQITEKKQHVKHSGRVAGMRHGKWYDGPYFAVYGDGGGKGSVEQWQEAMEIHWTKDRRELAEAIPPAYTRYLGGQLMNWLKSGGSQLTSTQMTLQDV